MSNRFTDLFMLLELPLSRCLCQAIQCFIHTRNDGKDYVCIYFFRARLDEQDLSFERWVHRRVYMRSGSVKDINAWRVHIAYKTALLKLSAKRLAHLPVLKGDHESF